jgi:dTDP-glucose 4,6-dehydratase
LKSLLRHESVIFMKTTLVTGGAGFIGSHFVEMLYDRFPDDAIVVLDVFTYAAWPDNIPERIRSSLRFELVKGDIRDEALVDGLVKRSHRLVHFAAESHVARSIGSDKPFFETDVMGTQSIAAAVSRHPVERFVHISTSEVYGTAQSVPMDENHPLDPCTPYAAAKAGADRLVYAYKRTYGIPTVIVRPFNNYGPRQHVEKVIPRFITQALLGEDLTMHGDGAMTRDWVYVTDTCEAVLKAMTMPGIDGMVINVGTGSDVSIKEIGRRIIELVPGTKSKIRVVPQRPGQVDRHISSRLRSGTLLEWSPEVALVEGLSKTVSWYRKNPAWWQRIVAEREVTVVEDGRRKAGLW